MLNLLKNVLWVFQQGDENFLVEISSSTMDYDGKSVTVVLGKHPPEDYKEISPEKQQHIDLNELLELDCPIRFAWLDTVYYLAVVKISSEGPKRRKTLIFFDDALRSHKKMQKSLIEEQLSGIRKNVNFMDKHGDD